MIEIEAQQYQQTKTDKAFSISVPASTINSLVREFDLSENEVESFVISMIEKTIMEHASAANARVFTESETKELEEDLRGLGYI